MQLLESDFNYTPQQAIALQKKLSSQVQISSFPIDKVKLIAGADISFNKNSSTIYAGIVVMTFPELELVEEASVVTESRFPYIPGLLSFREIPAITEVWKQLKHLPDVVVLDGQGIAHPRRMGIASHFGLLINGPTIGCAKSVLVGNFGELDNTKGSFANMHHKEEVVGAALRTKTGVKPVYISIGNKITLSDALQIMLHCSTKYRIPEPTRQAHLLVNRIRLEHIQATKPT